ncbi:probable G-protein coupled receptor 139 [Scyliorhinus canicula]|uniref:probable G-protein coupled receptor 139 n=1 Tax=Scyliorhinus canicula TaxID=7830 RepID=UPI0018F59B31|nr:probable G-protein coupled receptor 139 [Scyliorhinus canicula]
MGWNVTTLDRGLSDWFNRLSADDWSITLSDRILFSVCIVQHFYYPILAIVGVPANLLTIVTLKRRNCGLSKCVTCYLVAMAAADLLVIILDLILRHIPIIFDEQFTFLQSIHVCNIHAVLLYAANDCSVWFTVTFTFDRFVAICCSKLKNKGSECTVVTFADGTKIDGKTSDEKDREFGSSKPDVILLGSDVKKVGQRG